MIAKKISRTRILTFTAPFKPLVVVSRSCTAHLGGLILCTRIRITKIFQNCYYLVRFLDNPNLGLGQILCFSLSNQFKKNFR